MTLDEHRQAFIAFVGGLLADFDRYLARDDIDVVRDGGSYRLAAMWLDERELGEVTHELNRVLMPRLANPPRRGRERRVLATVFIPKTDPAP